MDALFCFVLFAALFSGFSRCLSFRLGLSFTRCGFLWLLRSSHAHLSAHCGNLLRAERVTYLLDEERAIATPSEGAQGFSRWTLKSSERKTEPLRP